jgi:hypothetical protein
VICSVGGSDAIGSGVTPPLGNCVKHLFDSSIGRSFPVATRCALPLTTFHRLDKDSFSACPGTVKMGCHLA